MQVLGVIVGSTGYRNINRKWRLWSTPLLALCCILLIKGTGGLQCYSCAHEVDVQGCRKTATCAQDEVCMLRVLSNDTGLKSYFETKCTTAQICTDALLQYQGIVASILGRKRSTPFFDNSVSLGKLCLVQCCEEDNCNDGCKIPTATASVPLTTDSVTVATASVDTSSASSPPTTATMTTAIANTTSATASNSQTSVTNPGSPPSNSPVQTANPTSDPAVPISLVPASPSPTSSAGTVNSTVTANPASQGASMATFAASHQPTLLNPNVSFATVSTAAPNTSIVVSTTAPTSGIPSSTDTLNKPSTMDSSTSNPQGNSPSSNVTASIASSSTAAAFTPAPTNKPISTSGTSNLASSATYTVSSTGSSVSTHEASAPSSTSSPITMTSQNAFTPATASVSASISTMTSTNSSTPATQSANTSASVTMTTNSSVTSSISPTNDVVTLTTSSVASLIKSSTSLPASASSSTTSSPIVVPTKSGPHSTVTTAPLISPTHPTFTCPHGYYAFGHSCYMFGKYEMDFNNAKKFCSSHGTHLVHIESEAENHFITQTIQHVLRGPVEFWLGITDHVTENEWRYIDTVTIATYFDWAANEPNNAHPFDGNANSADCAVISPDMNYKWYDQGCSIYQTAQPICEKRNPSLGP